MRQLNPPEVVSRAWQLAWRQRRTWFDMALVPVLWSLVLDMALLPDPARFTEITAQTAVAGGDAFRLFGSIVFYLLLSLVVWTTFATAWMRACVGAPPASRSLPGLSWTGYETRLLGASFRLILILMAGFAVAMVALGSGTMSSGFNPATAMAMGVVALLALAPFLARTCMVLPAAALGNDATLAGAWRLSAGNGIRLLALLVTLVIAGYLAGMLIGLITGSILRGIFGAPLSFGPRLVLLLVINVTSFATSAFTLAAIAVCYRQLGGGPGLQVVPSDRQGV